MTAKTSDTVLVTAASSFLGSHVAATLLKMGFPVRGTVRTEKKRQSTAKAVAGYAGVAEDAVEIVTADLGRDEGWEEAVSGVDTVIHCASPFPLSEPKDENEVIRPAREGTRRVLTAAHRAGVRRVVLTSSLIAVVGGHEHHGGPVHAGMWTDLDAPGLSAYAKSKTLAEQDAWQFQREQAERLELVAVNPGAILGPVILPQLGTSNRIVERILAGALPALPRVGFETVDVRDAAEAHVRAMMVQEAAGRRLLVGNGFLWFRDVAKMLAKAYPDRRIPQRELPGAVVRLAARFDPNLKATVADLNRRTDVRVTDTMDLLNWHPRPLMETVVETAESLLAEGLVGSG
jgi:dihydroflavonol-4-reductase